MSRRELLASALLGSTSLLIPGCSKSVSLPAGELLSTSIDIGHRIRDGSIKLTDVISWERIDTLIIGGGIAGLSAGWRLKLGGHNDFRIFELESRPGGTSRSDSSSVSQYPWGAHYVPLPNREYSALIQLFQEMDVLGTVESTGELIPAEHVACRAPKERLFVDGEWIDGLYPYSIATEKDLGQWHQFRRRILEWIDWRDASGRPAFTIPVAKCSDDKRVIQLDDISMTDWLSRQKFDSTPLLWYVDYCCRDDYGLTVDQTSAWAGLFYFASRIEKAGDEETPWLTWPAGNGEIVNYLANDITNNIECNQAVVRIEDVKADRVRITVFDAGKKKIRGVEASHVIFAAPQFLVPHLIPDILEQRAKLSRAFQYGAWVVANLHLKDRPKNNGRPLSWDNVIHESPSLGYVAATHQVGSDYGPTIWTWYLPLCDELPAKARKRLLDMKRDDWARFVLNDLSNAHPEIHKYVSRLDVMQWGHAMIQPRRGFIWGKERRKAMESVGSVHFAGTDLSGVALMEEAFYHGVRAAEDVLRQKGESILSIL